MAGRGGIKAGNAYIELTVLNGMARGLAGAQRSLAGLQRVAATAGIALTAAGVGLGAGLAAMGQTFVKFDDSMREMKAKIAGLTGKEFKELVGFARELGKNSAFTTEEIGKMFAAMARFGRSASDIRKQASGMLDFAMATNQSPEEAFSRAQAVMNQFGMTAKDTGRIVDTLTFIVNNSALDVSELADGLQYFGTVAADAGVPIEHAAAAVAKLKDAGVVASMSGRGLRSFLLSMIDKRQKLKDLLGVEISSPTEAGAFAELPRILMAIDKATKGMGAVDRMAVLNDIFGKLGITAASVAVRTKTGFAELAEGARKAAGEAAETAKIMQEGLGGSLRFLKSAWEELKIAVFAATSMEVQQFVDILKEGINSLSVWIGKNKDFALSLFTAVPIMLSLGVGLLAVASAAWIAMVALGAVSALVGTIGIGAGVLMGFWAMMSSGALGFAAAVAGGALQMRLLGKTFEALAAFDFGSILITFENAWADILTTVKNVAEAMRFKGLEGAWKALTLGFQITFAGLMLDLSGLWNTFKFEILGGLQGIFSILQDIYNNPLVQTALYGAGAGMTPEERSRNEALGKRAASFSESDQADYLADLDQVIRQGFRTQTGPQTTSQNRREVQEAEIRKAAYLREKDKLEFEKYWQDQRDKGLEDEARMLAELALLRQKHEAEQAAVEKQNALDEAAIKKDVADKEAAIKASLGDQTSQAADAVTTVSRELVSMVAGMRSGLLRSQAKKSNDVLEEQLQEQKRTTAAVHELKPAGLSA